LSILSKKESALMIFKKVVHIFPRLQIDTDSIVSVQMHQKNKEKNRIGRYKDIVV